MSPLLGFTPDTDPTKLGVITDCTNLVPNERGMEGGPSPVAASGVAVLPAECRGAAAVSLLSGSRRLFAGTQTRMYELSSGAWVDRSRAGNYTGSSENRWSIVQFGDATIAANDTEVLQASTAGAFADIATAPRARIVIAVANMLLAFNTVDGSFGDSPDRWWNCKPFDHTNWTPSVANQVASGRLVSAPGEITAAAPLGLNAVAFKARAMFLGTYVGPDARVWQWDQLPGEVGCVGPEAVCDVGGALVFAGEDNFHLFDGTRPVPIATNQVRQWFYENSSPVYRYRTQAIFDRQNNRVWFFFPGRSSSGACDRALVYHLVTQQWGRADRTIEAVLNYVSPGLTYDSVGSVYSTWEDLPDVPYDSQFWFAGGRVFSVFDSAHQLMNLVGGSESSSLTTGDYGDDDEVSCLNRVRLRFLRTPQSATVAGYVKQVAGDEIEPGDSGVLADGGFDLRQSGRWHRLIFNFTGPVMLNAISFDATKAGRR